MGPKTPPKRPQDRPQDPPKAYLGALRGPSCAFLGGSQIVSSYVVARSGAKSYEQDQELRAKSQEREQEY